MGLSLGKVNSIIQQFCIKEEPVARVRDMVVSASKNGIEYKSIECLTLSTPMPQKVQVG